MAVSSAPPLAQGALDGLSADVLGAVVALSEELHPHQRGRPHAGLEGDLDRDFGLDSLGRVEAIHRIEALFNVALPDSLFAEAATPHDLAFAVLRAGPAARPAPAAAKVTLGTSAAVAAPEALKTLPGVLAWHASHQGDRAHVVLSDGDIEREPLTYRALLRQAQAVAGGLAALGVGPGDRAALMLPTGPGFFAAFLGVVLAGAVPAPIYPPWRMLRIEEHLRRQARVLEKAGACALIAFDAALPFAELLRDHAPSLRFVTTAEALETASAPPAPAFVATPEDLALLQFTSGSTADPKGVMLSHANILANVRGLAAAIRATPADVYVSWLPLYHDMGLIAAWLACLDQAASFVVMSPLSFMARPERWLWTIHRNRATLTAAPNFAFELCLSIPEERLRGLDLSSLRVAGCGSEPISRRTIEDFTRRFAPYGFRPDALVPVYGLAESAAALTVSAVGRAPRVDYVDRRALSIRGVAQPVAAAAEGAQAFVSCGAPLIGHEVRVLDAIDREAPERREGRLQFRGPSASCGYFNDPAKTAELIVGGWLESGDLAYISEGEVFVTGRTKDVVKRAGRNIHPEDVEAAIDALPGVEPRGAVLFSATDPARGIERLVLVIETALTDAAARQSLVAAAQERAADYLETAVDHIALAPPVTIPRTESGKVRRAALRSLYLQGLQSDAGASPRRQALHLQSTAVLGRLRRGLRTAMERVYAWYWWSVIAALGIVLWPLVQVLPDLHSRWRSVHHASRLALRLLGHRVMVDRQGPTPDRDVVYVANHSSYLDSVVLSAILPGDLAFAGFKELAGDWIEGPFLRRLGVMFVERFEPHGALAAADEALANLESGRPLVIFPEATIMRMPGLLDFRMGAFRAAAQAGKPVIPVTIHGTRNILRHDHLWFPRRGNVEVRIGQAIAPSAADFEAAIALKNAARAEILAHVHEPDLAGETPLF